MRREVTQVLLDPADCPSDFPAKGVENGVEHAEDEVAYLVQEPKELRAPRGRALGVAASSSSVGRPSSTILPFCQGMLPGEC